MASKKKAGSKKEQMEAVTTAPGQRSEPQAAREDPNQVIREMTTTDLLYRATSDLLTAQNPLRLLVDSIPLLVSYVDKERRYQFNNAAYERWFGVSAEEMKGKPLSEVLGEQTYKIIKDRVDRVLAGEPVSFEEELPYKSGGTRYVHVDYVPDVAQSGEVRGYFAVINDISRRKAIEKELIQLNQNLEKRVSERTGMLEMLHDVATMTHEAQTIDEAFQSVMERVCEYNGWCFGQVFLVSEDDPDQLELTTYYYEDSPKRFERFRTATQATTLRKGEGLPGRVFESGEPRWTTDVDEDLLGPRSAAGESLDIKMAACFPVIAENEVVAVVEFFSDEIFEFDENRLQALASVNHHLSRVIERKRSEEAVRKSESRFRSVFENAAVGIAILDPEDDGEIVQANRTLARMLRYSASELKRKPLSELGDRTVETDSDSLPFQKLLTRERRSFRVERVMKSKDGAKVWTNAFFSLLHEGSTEIPSIIAIFEDITDQMEAEAALVETEEKFRALVEGVRDCAIFMLDPQGNIISWNSGAERINGYRTDEILGRHISYFYTPDDLIERKPHRALKTAAKKGKWEEEGWRVKKDGTRFYAHVLLTALYDEKGAVRGFAKITRDISERRNLEQMIANAALEEQRRIAGELHDGIGQQLTGIRFLTGSLAKKLEKEGSQASGFAEQLVDEVKSAQEDLRSLSRGVHPVEVDSQGLVHALQNLADEMVRIYQVDCVFSSEDAVSVQDNNTATQLYYIAREAVNNELKHGQPTRIVLELVETDGRIVLGVNGDGKGFNAAEKRGDGMGLEIMKHRAALIGARLKIESAPGQGTKITCRIRKEEYGLDQHT